MFQTILAGGEGRLTYMRKLAGERLTGQPASNYQNEDMLRGKRMEPEIRAFYEFTKDVEVYRVGFIRCGKLGASTDGLVGIDGCVEFKSMEPHLLIQLLDRKGPKIFPPRFYAQCQGALLASNCTWCDLVVYWPKMPKFVVHTERDEPYLLELRNAIDVFDLEIRRLVGRLKAL